jgi:hypothetical protein
MNRMRMSSRAITLLLVGQLLLATPALALNGGTLRVNTYNGWKAFEVITAGEDPSGDGYSHAMLTHFDGVGAWLPNPGTLRVLLNHEVNDTMLTELNIDLVDFQTAISNMINSGSTGGVTFVDSARQAYDSWSDDGGSSFTGTSDNSNTSFDRFCSGQSYAPHTFGTNRGFVDEIYITGEEFAPGNRLFGLDSRDRDFYRLSDTAGSAPGGIGGIPFDSYENAALVDTGETSHIALLLAPDGGTETMMLYIGEKGKDSSGSASSSFLARNGLAYGSWYYLIASYPSTGNTNNGSFSTFSSGSLTSDKIEDVDTSPSSPNLVIMGDQTDGLFRFDFDLVFNLSFDSGSSSFTISKIAGTSSGTNVVGQPDNLDWTDATTLNGTSYPDGLIFVNEDNNDGEIWLMLPDGSSKVRIADTTVSGESTGILDISELVGHMPGSILITNGQGTPSSMSVLINPDATLAPDAPFTPSVPALGDWAMLGLTLLLAAGGALVLLREREGLA